MSKQERLFTIANYLFPAIILVLSILSTTDLCMGGCSALSGYRLFGTSFAVGGAVYAVLLVASVYLTNRFRRAPWAVDLLIAIGLGAEIYFMAIQKLVVKKWCPICLTIAAVLVTFAILRGINAYRHRDVAASANMSHAVWLINLAGKTLLVLLCVLSGFMVAIVSVGKNPVALSQQARELEAAADQMTQQAPNPLATANVWFGNSKSPIEVYFVSDWYCGFCRKVEPVVESVLPLLAEKARYTWIDMAMHRESLNVIPYGLQALLKDKPNYLKTRRTLMRLTASNQVLSEDSIRAGLKQAGIPVSDLDKGALSLLYMDGTVFARSAGVTQTPSAVIVDTRTGRRQLLQGADQLTREGLLKAVKETNP